MLLLLLLSPGVTSRTDPGLSSHSTIVGGDGVLATATRKEAGDAKNMSNDDKINLSNIFSCPIQSMICQPNTPNPNENWFTSERYLSGYLVAPLFLTARSAEHNVARTSRILMIDVPNAPKSLQPGPRSTI